MNQEKIVLHDLDAYEIQQYQRNRYPMLFIDYVEEVEAGKYARGYKYFSYNEWFFPIHFEDEPVAPGFVLIEMMAQMFIMTALTFPETKGMKTASSKITDINIYKKVVPGMKIDIQATCDFYRRGVAIGHVEGYHEGELVCNSQYRVVIPDVLKKYSPKKEL